MQNLLVKIDIPYNDLRLQIVLYRRSPYDQFHYCSRSHILIRRNTYISYKSLNRLWVSRVRELRCSRPLPFPARYHQEQRIQR